MEKEEKKPVTLYMSAKAKRNLDKISEKLTKTNHGRSVTMDIIIGFSDANYDDMEAWYKKAKGK